MTQPAAPCPACGYPLDSDTCKLCEGSAQEMTSKARIEPGAGFFLFDLVEGFLSPFLAMLQLMTRKEYMGKLKWAVLANLVAFAVVSVLIGWGAYAFFTSMLPDWALSSWIGGIMAFLLAVLVVFFLGPVIIESVAAPFLDPIAEATEEIIAGGDMKSVDKGFWKNLLFGLNNAAKILAIQIMVMVPCLILSLIPIINVVAIPVSLLLAAYLNAVVWFEIPVMRRGYSMAYRRQILRNNRARALGFGLGFELGLFVPFFNFLFLTPATAVAVSQLYFRFKK
ncbi:MAG: EI24 domain-containing protein [Planctomycetota bacterium]|jgi:CysZ protein